MTELTFIEIAGLTIGISGLNIGMIMTYIKHLHKETQDDIKDLQCNLGKKFNLGKLEHARLDKRIDEVQ